MREAGIYRMGKGSEYRVAEGVFPYNVPLSTGIPLRTILRPATVHGADLEGSVV